MSSDHNPSIGRAYAQGLDCADRGGDVEKENPYYQDTELYIAFAIGFANRNTWKTRRPSGKGNE